VKYPGPITYRNPWTGDEVQLVEREGSDTFMGQPVPPEQRLWEMRRGAEWIGAADYLPMLKAKLERNGYGWQKG
jgi:hypothetical protein